MDIERLRQKISSDPDFRNQVKSELAKTAAKLSPGNLAAMAGIMTGASIVGSAISQEAAGGIQKLKAKVTHRGNFRRMMSENPDLQQLDKKQVGLAFNTLQKFNPEFASDPLVSGAWTRQIAGYGEGVPIDRLKGVVDSGKALAQTRQTVMSGQSPVLTAIDKSRQMGG